jgi:hypothetical protein
MAKLVACLQPHILQIKYARVIHLAQEVPMGKRNEECNLSQARRDTLRKTPIWHRVTGPLEALYTDWSAKKDAIGH